MSVRARSDAALQARIVRRVPMRYLRGADPALDRPAHVRAASALCWFGEHLCVLQDDAAFLGLLDPATGVVTDLPLPAGPGGARTFDERRGNKADKPDFELAFADGRRLCALGSGGLPARQRALCWARDQAPELRELGRFFAQVAAVALRGGTLNLEGCALVADQLVLANRGGDATGAIGDGQRATRDLLIWLSSSAFSVLLDDPATAPLPKMHALAVDLGELPQSEGALRFTDLSPRGGDELWYLAAAERTDSFFDDGEVAGSVLGVISGAARPGEVVLRHAPIYGESGGLALDKVEGVCAARSRPDRLWAVTDPDDPDRPGELLELELSGAW